MRRALVLTCTGLLVIAAIVCSSEGYIVVLKNKKYLRCRGPFEIHGEDAIMTLVTGTVVSYPVAKIDLVETERYNQLGFGDAILIEELTVRGDVIPTPTPRLPLEVGRTESTSISPCTVSPTRAGASTRCLSSSRARPVP